MLLIMNRQKLGHTMIKPTTPDEQLLVDTCTKILDGTPLLDTTCTAIWVDPRTEPTPARKNRP